MGHTTATTTIRVPLYVHYKCSYCGTTNNYVHVIKESRNVSRQGGAIREKTRNDLLGQSSEYAEMAMGKRLTRIFAERENRRYEKAGFNCRCKKCKKREPWAKMRYTPIDSILGVLLPFVLLLTLGFLLSQEIAAGLILGGCYASALAIWLIFKKAHSAKMNNLTKMLPEPSLPHFSLKKEDVFNID